MSNFLKYESIPIYESPLGLKQDITVKKTSITKFIYDVKSRRK